MKTNQPNLHETPRPCAAVIKPVMALFMGAALLVPATATAQETKGAPPAPGAESPTPLPKKDYGPAIPAEFNRPVPDYHVVRDGDTLFDLSSQYFGSPYLWPIVWSFNSHVTNPHWIYPGDIMYLRAPLPGDAPYNESGPSPFPGSDHGTAVALGGFWTERAAQKKGGGTASEDDEEGTEYEFEAVGRIKYSPENKGMLAFPDKVYLDLNDSEDENVKAGQVYAVLRGYGEVRDTEDDDTIIAKKFKVVGAVRVVEANPDHLHSAVVVQSWEEMYRGDLLFPYERQLLRVAPAVASDTTVGNIVDTIEVKSLFGEHDYIFINRGRKDGVRTGNRFFAYDKEDGFSNLDDDNDDELPYERLGQMMVIHVEEEFSTCLVTQSKRELERGMRIEMYQGY